MGSLFRACSVVLVVLWLFVAVVMVAAAITPGYLENREAATLAGIAVVYGWSGLFGLLPVAALFHIAGEVSVIAKARESGKR
jgi:hypothetical protein